MRELFWNMYQDILFRKCYYEEHQRRSEKLLFIARAVCAMVSIASVVIWSIARSMPVLWALLIAVAQVAQTLLNDLPWANQLACLKYFLPDLLKMVAEIEQDWMSLDYLGATDESLVSRIHEYTERFFAMESKYTTGIWFPAVKSVVHAAEKSADNHTDMRFREWKEEATDNV